MMRAQGLKDANFYATCDRSLGRVTWLNDIPIKRRNIKGQFPQEKTCSYCRSLRACQKGLFHECTGIRFMMNYMMYLYTVIHIISITVRDRRRRGDLTI